MAHAGNQSFENQEVAPPAEEVAAAASEASPAEALPGFGCLWWKRWQKVS